jgi:glutamate/tyrosine decarboxylase-like PLP-dependent enzyme
MARMKVGTGRRLMRANPEHDGVERFISALLQLADAFEGLARGIDHGGITPDVTPDEIRRHLGTRFDLSAAMPLDALVREVTGMLDRWIVHVTHRRYFGLFNPSVTTASVVADTLAAAFNPQLAAWSHAPAANELERFTLARLMPYFGCDPDSDVANFTTGGAEANLSALLVALAYRFPEFPRTGTRGLRRQPLVFLSDESHHSLVKAAQIAGLGSEAVRTVPTDAQGRMDVAALKRQVAEERLGGRTPLLVVGTAGSTSTGIIDPLPEIGSFCREQGLWFHIDAAWGGAAALSPRLRPHLAGIEAADSIVCDAHKWLSVPMGAGMFFCRHREAVRHAFQTQTPYMPVTTGHEVLDPFSTTVQWSRRFIGLKLAMSLAEHGLPGYAAMIEEHAELGDYLRDILRASGWDIVNTTPFPVVCFRREGVDAGDLARHIQRRQVAWMSAVPVRGRPAVRACVTSFRTTREDLDHVVGNIDRLAEELAHPRVGEPGDVGQ